MEAQSGEKVAGYTLENINLEYETIDNPKIATDITQLYMVGRSLTFENVTLLKDEKWDKNATVVNETINIPIITLVIRIGDFLLLTYVNNTSQTKAWGLI